MSGRVLREEYAQRHRRRRVPGSERQELAGCGAFGGIISAMNRNSAMPAPMQPSKFWIRWLLAVSTAVMVFGLLLVLAPALTRQGFSILIYASPERIESFGPEQVRYVSLVHAVIGGLMAGWGVALLYATKALLADGSRVGWNLIALSIAAWFVPDTAYSLASGYWQNALLNSAFLVLFVIPLWATRNASR